MAKFSSRRAQPTVASPQRGPTISKTIGLRNAACERMANRWALVDALRGGVEAMHAAGEKWLPKHKKEKPEDYELRLARTPLHTGYVDTVEGLAQKPFSKASTIDKGDKLDERLAHMIGDDVDNEGTAFDPFWRGVLEDSEHHGLSHVIVDMPPSPSNDRATEGELAPYCVHVPAVNVRRFEWRKTVAGRKQLTRIVYCEPREEIHPDTGREIEREYLREWVFVTPDDVAAAERLGIDRPKGYVALWRKDWSKEEWELIGAPVEISFVGSPVRTHYTKRVAFMEGAPPMDGLSKLNLEHYQGASEQKNILRVARCGIIAGFGLTKKDVEDGLIIGPNYAFLSTSNGSLEWKEHSGQGVGAGRQDQLDIEARMETHGVRPLLERVGDATATSRTIDSGESACELQDWVRRLEETAEAVVAIGAEWIGVELVEGFKVDFFDDFAVSVGANSDFPHVISLRRDGCLSKEDAFNEGKRRGIVAEGLKWSDVKARIDNDGPSLGEVTARAFGGDLANGGDKPSGGNPGAGGNPPAGAASGGAS